MIRRATTVLLLSASMVASPTLAQSARDAGAAPHYIFFDWGKPDISRDAATVLDEVVAAHTAASSSRLAISGHADRSGSAAHNKRSSRMRAESVAAWLAERGVPRSAMSITAHGEARPYIPTADGVREPQNRRVEILILR